MKGKSFIAFALRRQTIEVVGLLVEAINYGLYNFFDFNICAVSVFYYVCFSVQPLLFL